MTRLVLVIDETPFFHAEMVANLLDRFGDRIVGCALITEVPTKNSLNAYMVKNAHRLTGRELFSLSKKVISRKLGDMIGKITSGQGRNTVRSILVGAGVPYIEVKKNINEHKYLDWIARLWPDIVISSCSLYFARALLSLPRVGCINRHSSLLPAYGGILPVFHAISNGEDRIGVSVHHMTVGIDKGGVIARRTLMLGQGMTLEEAYSQCFDVSVEVIVEAVELLIANPSFSLPDISEPSYYSFPTALQWRMFRSQGGRFF